MDRRDSSLSADGSASGGERDVGARRGLTRRTSSSNITDTTERHAVDIMNVSRVNALRASVGRHCDLLTKILLTSKESTEKQGQIESAFRVCRDTFMEVSTVLVNLLGEGSTDADTISDGIKKTIENVVHTSLQKHSLQVSTVGSSAVATQQKTYASVVDSAGSQVRVSRGPTVKVPASTCFLVVPDEGNVENFKSSGETRDALFKSLKPADCGLRVSRVTSAPNNGVRIEAIRPDMDKIRSHPSLVKAGLKIVENTKSNPRLIVHGVPAELTREEIEEELTAQNLDRSEGAGIKVIYKFPLRQDRRTVSCVLEVPPTTRQALLRTGRIYLRYSACSFSDHVRVLQCYKCMAFGHIANNCKAEPSCGHCVGPYEMRDCKVRGKPPRCANCLRTRGHLMLDTKHSATDATKCPIIANKIKDKITLINYG